MGTDMAILSAVPQVRTTRKPMRHALLLNALVVLVTSVMIAIAAVGAASYLSGENLAAAARTVRS